MTIQSTAKAVSCARALKDILVLRKFAVAQSFDSNGWPKLTLNTAELSIKIEGVSAGSKDILGNDLVAFAPHLVSVSVDENAASAFAKVAEVMAEVSKLGMKVAFKSSATDLATAEGLAGDLIEADILWPTHGA